MELVSGVDFLLPLKWKLRLPNGSFESNDNAVSSNYSANKLDESNKISSTTGQNKFFVFASILAGYFKSNSQSECV